MGNRLQLPVMGPLWVDRSDGSILRLSPLVRLHLFPGIVSLDSN